MANVIGPDVSVYEDDNETPAGIDYTKMSKSAGFVIVRVGQNLWVDSDFKVNWREAKAAKMPRGSYWFYDSRVEPKKQADLWVAQFDGDFGELPLFADFEENYGGNYKGWKNWYTFLERVKTLVSGHEIGIYTAYYYWKENAPSASANLNYFKQYPLWIANYGVTKPSVPSPWTADGWLFWQYTESGDGLLYGAESKGIDLNYFNGDITALATRFNLTISDPDTDPVPTPDEDTPTGITYLVTAQPSLKVREGPGTSYNAIGLLYPNEVVEEINANSDRSWLKVRKADQTLIGWCSATYLQKVGETTTETKYYKVIASPSLKSREGPGLTYNSLGTYPYGTVVQELSANVDRTWLKVKNSDESLIGWSLAEYLEYIDSTSTPVDETGKKYRVTTTTLQVLADASSTATLVGLLYFGEIVNSLSKTTDGTWIKVQKSDGSLTGWCLSKDLLLVDDTETTPDDDSATPVPDDDDKKWYRVGTASVPVRETPSSTAKTLGTVILDDTLPALDDTSNSSWIQIRRVDGLTGWCEKKYLVFLSATRPTSIKQNLFKGVTFLQKDLTSPRKNRMYVMAIDLTTTGLEFLVTPSKSTNGVLCSCVTSKFLETYKLGVAINGDGFSYLDATAYPPATTCPSGGDPVKVNGYAASRGTIYSSVKTIQPTVYISSKSQVTINEKPNVVFNAVSGDRLVVQQGAVVKNLAALVPAPRTAVGLNKNGRWLIWMVIDGRQEGYSEGVTLDELAALLLTYGVYTGVNMDGGGSSAMVIKGIDGEARLLNSPIDQNIVGKERWVANHLGLLVK